MSEITPATVQSYSCLQLSATYQGFLLRFIGLQKEICIHRSRYYSAVAYVP